MVGFLSWWTKRQTGYRIIEIRDAMQDREQLFALLRKAYYAGMADAAQVCEDTDIVEGPSHQQMYCQLGDASATRSAIADAIRATAHDA